MPVEIKATNITWHEGHATREERNALLKQKGATLWFTGLSGSGKSTVAFTLEHALVQAGHLAYVLDGDNIRHGLNKHLGFTGTDDPYEAPLSAEITLDTTSTSPQEAAVLLIEYLQQQGLLG